MKFRVFLGFVFVVLVAVTAFAVFRRSATYPQTSVPSAQIAPTTDGTFSYVVLPDTQLYAQDHPEIFCDQTQWIVDNKEKLNIAFVSQLGDITNHGPHVDQEWKVASDCMAKLDGQVPYGIIPGNHDVDDYGNPVATFNAYNTTFPVSRFYVNPWYQGNFKENQNNFEVFTSAGQKLLVLNLEVDPPNDVLDWANKVLQDYKDVQAIVTTHVFLKDDTGQRTAEPFFRTGNNSAEDIWQKVISPNCNVFMVLSGHWHNADGENMLDSTNSCGDTVHQVVQDYQSREKGGNGRLRIYTFNPEEKRIDATTYSPVTQTYETDGDSQFSLEW